MKLKLTIISSITFSLLLISCSHSNAEITNFTYKFSMESVANFKVEFELKPDSMYRIGRYNYFFDNYENVKRPKVYEGKLTLKEFDHFRNLITNAKLAEMKDAYGFNNSHTERSIIYMLELATPETTKHISVNADANPKLSIQFTELLKHTSNFINTKEL